MSKKRSWFPLGLVLYALVFLGATALGLRYLWQAMAAYEDSRPNNAVQAYMDTLTREHILEESQALIDSIDHNLQSPQECRKILEKALAGDIRHTKKSRECTDSKMVYMLQTGSRVVGSFTMEAGEPDDYGFVPWALGEEHFDLSWLLGQPVTVTAPDVCTVTVNGVVLDERYVTATVPYEALEDYYGENDLPTQLTYTVPAVLGEHQLAISDREGRQIVLEEITDWRLYYNNCTDQESRTLESFVSAFLRRYVEFTGSNRKTHMEAYHKLEPYIRQGSDLSQRILNALDGLQFGQSVQDEIVTMDIRPQARLAEGFLVDVTYEVDTTGREGVVRTTTNMRLRIVYVGSAMKVESIQVY